MSWLMIDVGWPSSLWCWRPGVYKNVSWHEKGREQARKLALQQYPSMLLASIFLPWVPALTFPKDELWPGRISQINPFFLKSPFGWCSVVATEWNWNTGHSQPGRTGTVGLLGIVFVIFSHVTIAVVYPCTAEARKAADYPRMFWTVSLSPCQHKRTI